MIENLIFQSYGLSMTQQKTIKNEKVR